jgi:hypothetical protein
MGFILQRFLLGNLERRYRTPVSPPGLANSRASANEATGVLGILNRCSWMQLGICHHP